MKSDFFIVGADSQIGRGLSAKLRQRGHTVLGTTRRCKSEENNSIQLDLSDKPSEWRLPKQCGVTFLLAGVTSLALCETNSATTRIINVERTLTLSKMMRERGSHVVFLSTNLVLSGNHPYAPADETLAPQCEYGRQKADVEQNLLAAPTTASVLRTTKLAEGLLPLLRQWAEQLKQGRPVTAFSDLVCAPVSAEYVLDAIIRLAEIRYGGLLQIGGQLDQSYSQIALKLARFLGAPDHLVHATTSTAAGVLLPARPRFTTLDAGPTEALLGLRPENPEAIHAILLASSF